MFLAKPQACVVSSGLFFVIPAALHADPPTKIAKQVLPSVVVLKMQDSGGRNIGLGSGFAVKQGIVATNYHVIRDAARGYGKLVDQEETYAIRGLVASDEDRDLVLLELDSFDAPPLALCQREATVGQQVYAAGSPAGLEGTFSAGLISAIRKAEGNRLLQVTAPISPGSSGGPIVNDVGEVIGVACATLRNGQNLNFAIPIRHVQLLLDQMKPPVPLARATRKGRKELKSAIDRIGDGGHIREKRPPFEAGIELTSPVVGMAGRFVVRGQSIPQILEVEQVLGDDAIRGTVVTGLGTSQDFLFVGIDASAMVDGMRVSLDGYWEITGTKSYTTVIGAVRTVFVLEPIDISPYLEADRKKAEEKRIAAKEAEEDRKAEAASQKRQSLSKLSASLVRTEVTGQKGWWYLTIQNNSPYTIEDIRIRITGIPKDENGNTFKIAIFRRVPPKKSCTTMISLGEAENPICTILPD